MLVSVSLPPCLFVLKSVIDFFLILGPYGSSHVPLLNRSPALSRISLSFCSKIFFNPVTVLFLQIPNTVSTLKIGTKDYKCTNSCLSKPLSVLLKYLAICIALNWEVLFCFNFLYILFASSRILNVHFILKSHINIRNYTVPKYAA